MVNLSVKIGKLKLKNPVIAASGTIGVEYKDLVDINSLGAVVMKTITLNPRTGNRPPRVAETPSGMLNSIGLENKGLVDFLENKLPVMSAAKVPIIASIAGDDGKEFAHLVRVLSKVEKIGAIELNLSCPNVRHGTRDCLIAQDDKSTFEIVRAARKSTRATLIAKLSPNVTDIVKIAKAAEDAGADALSLVNTFFGMAVDIDTKRPLLGNVTGGLSGPAIRPIAICMVWEAYNKVKIPIIGGGGIMNYRDALEFILSGALAVQVGTVNFVDPKAPADIVAGIRRYLSKNKIKDVRRLTGALKI